MKKLGADKWIDFKTEKDIIKAVQAAVPDGLGPHAAVVASVSGKFCRSTPKKNLSLNHPK